MKIKLKKQVFNEDYVQIEVAISTDDNYFSITGTTYDKNNKWVSSGCVHNDIMKHYPELEIFIDLHLSDLNGKPMHFVSNSMYYYQTNNINGLIGYGFNQRQAEYLCANKPDEALFNDLVKSWGILDVWKYKANLAMSLIKELSKQWEDLMRDEKYLFMVTLSNDTGFLLIEGKCLNDVFKEIMDEHNIQVSNIDSIYRLKAGALAPMFNDINVELVFCNCVD